MFDAPARTQQHGLSLAKPASSVLLGAPAFWPGLARRKYSLAAYETRANAYTRRKFGMASAMPPAHVEVRGVAWRVRLAPQAKRQRQ